jgi:hypothetical protein
MSLCPRFSPSADRGPHVQFPSQLRERIAIASYPFRDFILGSRDGASAQKMDLKDFAAHCREKLGISKIEPWNRHFRSTDAKYLEEFRASVEKTRGAVVNIAVDGDHSPYSTDASERDLAVAFSKKWIEVPSVLRACERISRKRKTPSPTCRGLPRLSNAWSSTPPLRMS